MSFLVKVNVVFGSNRVSAKMHLESKGRVGAQQMLCRVPQIVVPSERAYSGTSRCIQDSTTSNQEFI